MIFFSNKQQVDMLHYQVDQAPASHDHGDNVAARGAEVVGEYGTIAEKRPLCQNKGPLKTSFMAQFSLKRGFCHKIAETPTFSKTTGAHSAALFTNGKRQHQREFSELMAVAWQDPPRRPAPSTHGVARLQPTAQGKKTI